MSGSAPIRAEFLGNAYDAGRVGEGHRHRRGVVRFGLDPRLCAGAAARAEMAGLALSRRLGPASRLVSFLAARSLRHARPRALRRGADARLRARRGRAQDVEIARQRHRAAGRDEAERRRHPAPVGGRLGLLRGSAHRPGDPQAPQADAYRRLRNTLRYLLGALDGYPPSEAVGAEAMPELERWVLHRLAELDRLVRRAVEALRFPRHVHRAAQFLRGRSVGLLFRHPQGPALLRRGRTMRARRATRTVLDRVFDCLVRWLAPILCFTAEEAWLARHGDEPGRSVHLELFADVPGGLARRRARRALGGAARSAPRRHRRARTGARRKADRVEPAGRGRAVRARERLADGCATSISPNSASPRPATVSRRPPPADAFTLPDCPGIGVGRAPAPGERCERCWRVLPEVGSVSRATPISASAAPTWSIAAARSRCGRNGMMLARGLAAAAGGRRRSTSSSKHRGAGAFRRARLRRPARDGDRRSSIWCSTCNRGISFGLFNSGAGAERAGLHARRRGIVAVLMFWLARVRSGLPRRRDRPDHRRRGRQCDRPAALWRGRRLSLFSSRRMALAGLQSCRQRDLHRGAGNACSTDCSPRRHPSKQPDRTIRCHDQIDTHSCGTAPDCFTGGCCRRCGNTVVRLLRFQTGGRHREDAARRIRRRINGRR